MMLGILFGLFFLLLFIGMPVAYGMVISAVVTLFFDPSLTGIIIPQKLFTGMDSFSLMAVPFFMLAGTLMEKSGITDILVNWAKSLVGHFKGGLGHATIVTGVVMAGVSGSANADTSALASILVPIMRKDGYDDGYSCALVSSCGALGPVIPPSIMMVLYSGVTSIAIGKLFMAGIIPGLVIAVGYMIVNGVYARKAGIPKSKFVGWKALGQDTLKALPALIMPVIIIGGILSGATTATEAGVVACVYSIIYDMTLEDWQRVQNTNITGAFLCSKYAIPVMKRNHYGRIIMTSSVTAQQGALFGQVHYASTKGAQQSFAKTLARTVALDGITVNCVAPGTHMTETLHEILVNSDPHRLDAAIERTPMGKIGTCEDVAYAVVYLASEEAGYVTGACIDVNGGCYMRS